MSEKEEKEQQENKNLSEGEKLGLIGFILFSDRTWQKLCCNFGLSRVCLNHKNGNKIKKAPSGIGSTVGS